ncbi:MAG: hypothetical protein IJU50_06820 [Lachnospiraceae bacterium]|nr:hypothetical protein [Lachnospiraceae bacterium]
MQELLLTIIFQELSLYGVSVLSKLYDVSMEYLMGLSEFRKPSLTPMESLHINKEMIKMLQNLLQTRLPEESGGL